MNSFAFLPTDYKIFLQKPMPDIIKNHHIKVARTSTVTCLPESQQKAHGKESHSPRSMQSSSANWNKLVLHWPRKARKVTAFLRSCVNGSYKHSTSGQARTLSTPILFSEQHQKLERLMWNGVFQWNQIRCFNLHHSFSHLVDHFSGNMFSSLNHQNRLYSLSSWPQCLRVLKLPRHTRQERFKPRWYYYHFKQQYVWQYKNIARRHYHFSERSCSR